MFQELSIFSIMKTKKPHQKPVEGKQTKDFASPLPLFKDDPALVE